MLVLLVKLVAVVSIRDCHDGAALDKVAEVWCVGSSLLSTFLGVGGTGGDAFVGTGGSGAGGLVARSGVELVGSEYLGGRSKSSISGKVGALCILEMSLNVGNRAVEEFPGVAGVQGLCWYDW